MKQVDHEILAINDIISLNKLLFVLYYTTHNKVNFKLLKDLQPKISKTINLNIKAYLDNLLYDKSYLLSSNMYFENLLNTVFLL